MIDCKFSLSLDSNNKNHKGVFHRWADCLHHEHGKTYILTMGIVEDTATGNLYEVRPSHIKLLHGFADRFYGAITAIIENSKAPFIHKQSLKKAVANYFKNYSV